MTHKDRTIGRTSLGGFTAKDQDSLCPSTSQLMWDTRTILTHAPDKDPSVARGSDGRFWKEVTPCPE
jgi:hypothetical protein